MTFVQCPNVRNPRAIHRSWWLLPVRCRLFESSSMFCDGYPANWQNCRSMSVSMHFFGKFSTWIKWWISKEFHMNRMFWVAENIYDAHRYLHYRERFSNNFEGLVVPLPNFRCSTLYSLMIYRMFVGGGLVQPHRHFAINNNYNFFLLNHKRAYGICWRGRKRTRNEIIFRTNQIDKYKTLSTPSLSLEDLMHSIKIKTNKNVI